MTASRRGAAAALLAIGALLAVAGGAAAHAQLVASSPAPGEVLGAPPTELRLTFSEPLEAGFSSADLVDADGTTLLERAGEIDPGDAFTLIVPLPALEEGVYTVRWRSLSTADGHPAEGFFSFGVGDVTVTGTPSGQATGGADPSDPIGLAGKWVTYLALLLSVGVPFFAVAVLRGEAHLRARVSTGLAALLVAGALAMLALAVRVPLVDGEPIADYLFGSRGGLLALARTLVMLAGAAAVLVLARRAPRERALAAAAVTGVLGIGLHIAGGHAAASGSPVPVLVQLVHLVAAGAWLSGIAMLAIIASRPAEILEGAVPPLHSIVPRFSALALTAIGLVLATGLFAEWTQIGGLPTTDDAYGRALILKLLVVAAALGVGAFNYLDGGSYRRWLGGLPARLATESGLVLAVLAATALLSTTPPAVGRGVPLAPVPSALGEVQQAIGLSMAPARPGVNQLTVEMRGNIGDLPLDLLLTRVDTGAQTRISLAGNATGGAPVDHTEHAAAPTSGAQRFVANTLVFPAGSSWDATVVIDDDLIRQRFTFAMGENGLTDGAAGSLADGALVAGLALLAGGTLALGLGLGGFRLPRCEAVASRVALLGGGGLAAVTGLAIGVGRLVGAA